MEAKISRAPSGDHTGCESVKGSNVNLVGTPRAASSTQISLFPVTSVRSAATRLASGANATLAEEAIRQGIPVQNLGLLAQIGTPIAQLGQQSSGTTTGTQDMSGAQQFATLAGGISSLLGTGPTQNTNGMSGGSGLLGLLRFSDRRLKEDIAVVGSLFDGTPVYRYRYIGAPAYHIGLIAQDVEKVFPRWVGEGKDGYKTLDVPPRELAAMEVEAFRTLKAENDELRRELNDQAKRLNRELLDKRKP